MIPMVVIAALVVSFLTILGNVKYLKGIIQGQVIPTKATWIIFCTVTSLSVSSFLTVRFDLVSGAGVVTDFSVASLVLLTTLIKFRREKLRLNSFEKYYLLAACGCLVFWLLSSNPFVTNILVQMLLTLGYIPTIHNILVTKRSTESKFAWSMWILATVLSFYPALVNHNFLALIYASRGLVMGSTVLALTFKFPALPRIS
ncbi:MAG: hypothetical protein A2Y67_04240 [Candidatus Buchananbacteria bacterium RBG_13_39_9]|uniref:Uncharacterized protein n=1 Tax=Candidatus Buchananbacteria bacterium RBG_13_39_9 TaxID=1797531 RepID=A0A1G1XQ97_9BACT|nr:MAG: hypothetical protein A2Y67_04240 [Candidatus Buchananbacteria bacterium RBG_13_39_9]